jgi:hypothetical protein
LLLNLRYCLEICGANTTYTRTIIDPRELRTPFLAPASYYNEPLWIKNNFGNKNIRETIPIKPLPKADYDYYWQVRQPNRSIRQVNSINGRITPEQQYFSNPNLDSMPMSMPVLPSISNPAFMAPYVMLDNSPRKDPIAAKAALYDRVNINEIENEMRNLKSRLKRMESLLQSKNSRIQELIFELEKTKYKKSKP